MKKMIITMDEVRKVQKYQLGIVLEVDRICKRYNIKYCLFYGSLLGAVRHHGFIPWDSDLDIVMLRDDYNKFIDVCKYELSPLYFLQTHVTDNNFMKPMARICANGTKYVFEGMEQASIHPGIFIDIGPVDTAPKYKIQQLYQYFMMLWLKPAILFKSKNIIYKKKSLFGILVYLFFELPFILSNCDKMYNRLENVMLKYNNSKSPYYIPCAELQLVSYVRGFSIIKSGRYSANCLPKEYYTELTELLFEGYWLPCPVKYHEILTRLYGEYMTPPPRDKQKSLDSIVCLEFND